jgi:hypothetical protein
LIRAVTLDWTQFSASAARLTLPVSATAFTTRKPARSIAPSPSPFRAWHPSLEVELIIRTIHWK